jgi:Flp pilus assembly pilin Flp
MLLSLFVKVQTLRAAFRSRFEDETGAVGTEYALLLVLIAIVFTVGAIALGVAINARLQEGADCVSGVGACP